MSLSVIAIATQGLLSGDEDLIALQGFLEVTIITVTSGSGRRRRRRVVHDRMWQKLLREDREITKIIEVFVRECLD